jgi:hypothetical protein
MKSFKHRALEKQNAKPNMYGINFAAIVTPLISVVHLIPV